ncbi:hypothetical protein V6N13_009636 [Hibiscus sabdariffa]
MKAWSCPGPDLKIVLEKTARKVLDHLRVHGNSILHGLKHHMPSNFNPDFVKVTRRSSKPLRASNRRHLHYKLQLQNTESYHIKGIIQLLHYN